MWNAKSKTTNKWDRIILGDLADHIKIDPSPRAKRLALRLDTKERQVRFVIPLRASINKAQEFLDLHSDWVTEQITALPDSIPFRHGSVIPLEGQAITIQETLDITLKRTSIELKNNILFVKTNKDNPSGRIERYLKSLAKKDLSALAHEKAERIGKRIQSIAIRDTKSRWGSCGPNGQISFSWRLVFAPPAALDYVVAHEVAHLEHLNHGPLFWNLCEELCADYKTGKKWMRQHGHDLMRYG